jgi:alkaline phosphatase D
MSNAKGDRSADISKVQLKDSLQLDPLLVSALDESLKPFYHGVASGDPTNNAVVIWTRITPEHSIEKIDVEWELATDEGFSHLVSSGKYTTGPYRDFTVKVDVTGLQPGLTYYYRFKQGNFTSIIGTTKTIPINPSEMKIAFASCSNYEWGYFNAYGAMAIDDDIDLIVHLGDYIYEYAIGHYGDTSLGRLNVPAGEIITLQDYRSRYSIYRLDEDLMMAHQNKPFITTWDDHEIANNSYMDGAENHQDSTEGNWYSRKSAGTKAYYEWLPVREPTDRLYRSFKAGELFNLIILDTRIAGRTEQIYDPENESYKDESRSILGKEQYDWLTKELKEEQRWKIIGNQVPVGPMIVPTEEGSHPYMDGWDGYPAERNRLLKFITEHKMKNSIFMTGDYHSAFAIETPFGNANAAVEFVVPSINSSNYDEHTDSNTVVRAAEGYRKYNPHVRYCNLTDHGYVSLTIRKDQALAEFVYVETVKTRDLSVTTAVSFLVPSDVSIIKKR